MELSDNPKLYTIRHSFAHVLAQAVKQLFPKAKLGFGPPTDTGFYYDFDFGAEKVSESDFKNIEKAMKKIIRQKQEFEKSEGDADNAKKILGDQAESYKVENVENLVGRGESHFSFYKNGDFVDLCEGPHVAHTGELPENAFKIERIAGAYWLGDEKKPMLTRIYVDCFETRDDLEDFLKRKKVAKEFDHKKLGKELEIYTQSDLVGKGLILWLPNGTVIRDEIEKFACELEFKYGYKRVRTPHITKDKLFWKSQHLPAYLEGMFPPMEVKEDDGEVVEKMYLKPMNCPFHHLIFDDRPRSYRELPLRLAEYGTCYRYEQSGETSGLIRVRCMTMNDAHLYITEDQFKEEFTGVLKLYDEFYRTFKLTNYKYRLSLRSKEEEEKFKGDLSMWDRAETLLREIMDELKLPYYEAEGEAAFYGPKIDIQFKNLMGREETISTIQVDYLSSKNFGLKYIDEHGEEKQPVILHRAPLSTHERFLSFLIEYYGGAFPTWCAPVQVCLIAVNEGVMEYCRELKSKLFENGIRVEIDDSNNSFNKKIRTNTMKKIPNLLIIGDKEKDTRSVTVRKYGQREQNTLGFEEYLEVILNEIKTRQMDREPMGSII